jgi:hypothetical protein
VELLADSGADSTGAALRFGQIVQLEGGVQHQFVRHLLVAHPVPQAAHTPAGRAPVLPTSLPRCTAGIIILFHLVRPRNLLELAPEAFDLGAKLDAQPAVAGLILWKVHLSLLESDQCMADAPCQLLLIRDLPRLEVLEELVQICNEVGSKVLGNVTERAPLDDELGDALNKFHEHRSAVEERRLKLLHLLKDMGLLVRDHEPSQKDAHVDGRRVGLVWPWAVKGFSLQVDALEEALGDLDTRRLSQKDDQGLKTGRKQRGGLGGRNHIKIQQENIHLMFFTHSIVTPVLGLRKAAAYFLVRAC